MATQTVSLSQPYGNRAEVIEAEEELLAMLKPCADEALKIWPVDKMVGNVRNKGPQLAMAI